jgi:hypothetical protein
MRGAAGRGLKSNCAPIFSIRPSANAVGRNHADPNVLL